MVRRRSTVRFRKGAPGYGDFSNLEPSTSFWRVAFEWQRQMEQAPVAPCLGTESDEVLALCRQAVTDRRLGAQARTWLLIKNPSQNILSALPWLHSIRAVRFVRPGEPGRIPLLR
jgi:hypothetical protein